VNCGNLAEGPRSRWCRDHATFGDYLDPLIDGGGYRLLRVAECAGGLSDRTALRVNGGGMATRPDAGRHRFEPDCLEPLWVQ